MDEQPMVLAEDVQDVRKHLFASPDSGTYAEPHHAHSGSIWRSHGDRRGTTAKKESNPRCTADQAIL